MDDLADRFADRGVTSVFLYTREAHPGERYPHHTTMEVKRANARAFRTHSHVRRRILLDDIEGTAHRAFGALPNMTWIAGPGGVVHYKAAWTELSDLEDALVAALASRERRGREPIRPYYSERLVWRSEDIEAFRAGLERNGPKAVTDFFGGAVKD